MEGRHLIPKQADAYDGCTQMRIIRSERQPRRYYKDGDYYYREDLWIFYDGSIWHGFIPNQNTTLATFKRSKENPRNYGIYPAKPLDKQPEVS